MREVVNHPVYGLIIYDEGIWTGKRTLTVNGVNAVKIRKNEYNLNGKNVILKGNYITGITLFIDNITVIITPKTKWYEFVLAFIPLCFLLTWGNDPSLCAIFPVVGGAVGGALGGLGTVATVFFMKKQDSLLLKLVVGISSAILTIFAGFILGLLILQVLK